MAELLEGQPCPKCRGELVFSGMNVFCVQLYSKGGCGTTWQRTRGKTKGGWRELR